MWLLGHPQSETLKGRLPLLEHLELRQGYAGEAVEGDYGLFSDCPQLRTFNTQWPPNYVQRGPSLLETVELPWTQIRFCTVNVGQLPTLLSKPRGALEKLCIEDMEGEEPQNISGDEQWAVNVSSLKLVEFRSGIVVLLDYISFPRMSSLEISSYNRSSCRRVFESLAQSSTTTCLDLTLRGSCKDDVDIPSLLRHAPMVHTFSLQTKPLCKEILFQEFFGDLTLSHERFPTPNHLLPALEDFTIHLHKLTKVDDEAIVRALASRWLPDPELTPS
ncbi:hypothetical protein V5O48_018998, partial [Marasmius crinis-equi]